MLTVLLFGLAGWAFWPALQDLVERWISDPQYSYGAAVPIVALLACWWRRHSLPYPRRPALLGLGIVAAGLGLSYVGETAFIECFQGLGFIIVLCGIVAAVNGWRAFLWALPGMALLLFAVPPPYRVHAFLAEPLQRMMALGTAGLLELRGRPAVAMGDLVIIGDARMSVADACSGVGMLFVFVFAAAIIAALSRRPLVDKALMFLAAPAFGLAANVLRIGATVEAKSMGYSAGFVGRAHDVGGYLLAPAALLMLLVLLGIVALVFPATRPADEPLQIAFQLGVVDRDQLTAPRRNRPMRPRTSDR